MFCPRCGQEQISLEVLYCKYCGLQLSTVRDLLTGNVPEKSPDGLGQYTNKKIPPSIRKAFKQGAIIIFSAFSIIFLIAAQSVFNFVLLSPKILTFALLTLVVLSVFRLVYGVVFGKHSLFASDESETTNAVARFGSIAGARPSALPPANSEIFSGFGKQRVNTSELVSPPSVTESTTKLLHKQPEEGRN